MGFENSIQVGDKNVKEVSNWNENGIEKLNNTTRTLKKSLTNSMSQAEDIISGHEDKEENLDQRRQV